MQLNFLPVSLLAAAAAASPCKHERPDSGIPAGAKFQLQALRSASEIHFAPFSAAKSSLFLNLPDQGASCDKEADSATFYIQDGGLYLYAASATPQQIYVDRSGMGMSTSLFSLLAQEFVLTIPTRPRKGWLHHRRPAPSPQRREDWLGDRQVG